MSNSTESHRVTHASGTLHFTTLTVKSCGAQCHQAQFAVATDGACTMHLVEKVGCPLLDLKKS